MKPNRLRELLNEGKPTIGTHIVIPWPRLVELIGHTSAFDYIEYLGEYSTFTIEQFENFGRAIELFPNMSAVSARPTLPKTRRTSGKRRRSLSVVWSTSRALVGEMPGKVVGM